MAVTRTRGTCQGREEPNGQDKVEISEKFAKYCAEFT